MESTRQEPSGKIPNQYSIPWSVAFQVSWAGVRRRIFRSAITMLGVCAIETVADSASDARARALKGLNIRFKSFIPVLLLKTFQRLRAKGH